MTAWLALAALPVVAAVAVCAAHIPVLRVLTGAAPATPPHLESDDTAAGGTQ